MVKTLKIYYIKAYFRNYVCIKDIFLMLGLSDMR